ncbi:MAG: ester cyclase [Solirubrobacterales bacterium]|nr:ester cyclase [Solirubrobacterales bacterium]
MAISPDVRAARERLVREHMESENRHEYDVTMGTFRHPRYEIIPTGDVYDGEEAVRGYFAETRTAFPDQRNELVALHHADDAVIVEFDLLGTHLGSFRGLPATGRSFRCRMTAFFVFGGNDDGAGRGDGDGLIAERVYFDSATILRQLGIAHDPLTLRGRLATVLNHPLTIGGAVAKDLARRRASRPT